MAIRRLVEPANPEALAAGIVELLTHTERAKHMARQGQTVVREKFSIETMVDKNIKVYQHILTAGGSD